METHINYKFKDLGGIHASNVSSHVSFTHNKRAQAMYLFEKCAHRRHCTQTQQRIEPKGLRCISHTRKGGTKLKGSKAQRSAHYAEKG